MISLLSKAKLEQGELMRSGADVGILVRDHLVDEYRVAESVVSGTGNCVRGWRVVTGRVH